MNFSPSTKARSFPYSPAGSCETPLRQTRKAQNALGGQTLRLREHLAVLAHTAFLGSPPTVKDHRRTDS